MNENLTNTVFKVKIKIYKNIQLIVLLMEARKSCFIESGHLMSQQGVNKHIQIQNKHIIWNGRRNFSERLEGLIDFAHEKMI
jgi:hypothetical protein